MSGENIIHARTAVVEFLKILPLDSYFNIVSFGFNYTMLSDGWVYLQFNQLIILCMRPTNERRRYNVMSLSLAGAHTHKDPWLPVCLPHAAWFYFFYRKSLENTAANNKMARKRVLKMEADMGGTEIGRPLKAVYDLPLVTGYPRSVSTF